MTTFEPVYDNQGGTRPEANPRTVAVIEKLKDAMNAIERERRLNDGIYPLNGGRISAAEVYRRAGIHFTTVNKGAKKSQAYIDIISEINQWISSIEAKEPVKRVDVKRTLKNRVSEWRALFEDALQAQQLSETAMQSLEVELKTAKHNIKKLSLENERLTLELNKLTSNNVTPIR